MITIVGAGLAGLSAAYHLNKEYTILERETTVGGLCKSININGYTFDYAPHILFTRNPYTKQLFKEQLGDGLPVAKQSLAVSDQEGVQSPLLALRLVQEKEGLGRRRADH